jgi:Sugar (and other) transporter
MLGVAGVPAALQLVGMLFLPESPRWLAEKGEEEAALAVLCRVRTTPAAAAAELCRVRTQLSESARTRSHSPYLDLIRVPTHRRALFLGVGLQLFQQLCGINTVMYYSATILKVRPPLCVWCCSCCCSC